MNVLVIQQVIGDDIYFVLVCPDPVMVSGRLKLEGEALRASCNPYGVYGPVCERFTGRKWNELIITVAEFTSGGIDWFVADENV